MRCNTRRAVILSGGDLNKTFAKDFLQRESYDWIICVDGALKVADELGLKLDWLVGDFDSVSSDLIKKYEELSKTGQIETVIRRFQPEKDATDTLIAMRNNFV